MKKLIIAVLMFIPVAVMAKVDVYKCDASHVAGLSQPESGDFIVTSTISSASGFATVADAGVLFQAVVKGNVMTSPKLNQVSDKSSAASIDGFTFLRRDGEYIIIIGDGTALLFNNCKPVNGGKK